MKMSKRTIAGMTALAISLVLQGSRLAGALQIAAEPISCGAPAPAASVRFAVIGDYGTATQAESDVAALVASWVPDLVLTVGDNNYPAGEASTIDANIGQYYHEFICPYTGVYGTGSATNRFFPALGNHDWAATNAQPHIDYFALPGNERYYDFVQGPVHFFVLDSDASEPDGNTQSSTQGAWLQAALAASTSPWDIVLLHHPPYSSGATHGSTPELQWPFQQWGADAVLAGHDHTYERIVLNGFPYFVNGLGGAPIYDFATAVPGSQVRYNTDHGAMLVDATDTNIHLRFVTRSGTIIDSYRLSKPWVPLDPARIHFQQVTGGLSSPIGITNAGDGSGRLFIIERSGRIRIVKDGVLLTTPFLDIQSAVKSGGEQGLLALAFHPSYSSNGFFYVAYTAPSLDPEDETGSILTLERYTVSAVPDVADDASASPVLTIDHPAQANHNGGTLGFGPDGFLYWSTGDGGGGGDPGENAQDLTELLGKILRLDVDSASPYAVPASNPFSSSPNVNTKLIWAYGLRNPWRMSFDRVTGDLYIGDVGQNLWEEIDYQPASNPGGENYGWDMYEANDAYNPPFEGPYDPTGKTFPVASYDHDQGCSVTGGHVYRGAAFPSLVGRYFYGDFCSGRIFSMYNDPDSGWSSGELLDTPYLISTFGEDEDGELHLAHLSSGVIYKLTYDEPLYFADMPVPGKEWMEPWANAFYDAGITTGCGQNPLIYCPENQVTRAEMAVFLLRAVHGAAYVPPAASHFFTDVPVAGKEWMEPWIDQFYAEGITTGCGGGNYCPENKATRAEMAVFLLRALHGGGYSPPPASGVFADVPVPGKEWMEPWIIQFYNEGITTGCGGGNYCPENNVTRAEMAVFIGRAYDLYP
jgi:glucose/arabinose dehydrogenase